MIKVILIGSDDSSYKVVKRVVSELDFLYEDELQLIYFRNISQKVKKEIMDTDTKKIYIINIQKINYEKYYPLVKFIRDKDWKSEIILMHGENVILDKQWNHLCNIFAVIDHADGQDMLKEHLGLICKHRMREKTFQFKNRDVNLNILFEKILYIYRDTRERKVVIVTDNNIYTLNLGLKETMMLLDNRFKQVHRACVVNTLRTEKFDWGNNSFILDNGNKVNLLSKHYKDNF